MGTRARINSNLHSVAGCARDRPTVRLSVFEKGRKPTPVNIAGCTSVKKKIVDRLAAVWALRSRKCRRASCQGHRFLE